MKKGEHILWAQDEQVTFKVFKAMPQLSNVKKYFKIDNKDKPIVETSKEEPQKLLSEESNQCKSSKSKNTKVWEQNFYLKVAPPNWI